MDSKKKKRELKCKNVQKNLHDVTLKKENHIGEEQPMEIKKESKLPCLLASITK